MERRNQMTAALAALLMVIDHVGAIFFPGDMGFRLIGRLSFPLFAYGIAQGVAYTSNFPKYLFRILLAAVVSQPIYWLAFYSTNLNPLFTLALGALVLWLSRRGQKEQILAMILLLLSVGLKSSYSWYGVATIYLYGFYYCAREISFYGQLALQIIYGFTTGAWIQSFSICAFPFAGRIWKNQILLPQYFLYIFYPLHLLILIGIREIIY